MGPADGEQMVDTQATEPELCGGGKTAAIAKENRRAQSLIPHMRGQKRRQMAPPLSEPQTQCDGAAADGERIRCGAGYDRSLCAVIPLRRKAIVLRPFLHRDTAADALSVLPAARVLRCEKHRIRQPVHIVREAHKIAPAIDILRVDIEHHALARVRFANRFCVRGTVQIVITEREQSGENARRADNKRKIPFPRLQNAPSKHHSAADDAWRRKKRDPTGGVQTGEDRRADVKSKKQQDDSVFPDNGIDRPYTRAHIYSSVPHKFFHSTGQVYRAPGVFVNRCNTNSAPPRQNFLSTDRGMHILPSRAVERAGDGTDPGKRAPLFPPELSSPPPLED